MRATSMPWRSTLCGFASKRCIGSVRTPSPRHPVRIAIHDPEAVEAA